MIYRNQPVFVLPDMQRMQVKVGIHETLVSKVAPEQIAVIKVDAFAGLTLSGKVKSVSQMSASTRWERSNNYHVIVTIDSFPDDIRLKPGMNAEVEILVGTYADRLAVPIQSVTSFGQQKYVFAQNKNNEFEAREVETDETTISFVAIKSGLQDGDVVALDAYQRGLAEFDTNDTEKMLELQLEEMDEASKLKTVATKGEPEPGEEENESKVGLTSEESARLPAGGEAQSMNPGSESAEQKKNDSVTDEPADKPMTFEWRSGADVDA